MKKLLILIALSSASLYPSANQTSDISPVSVGQSLPFSISIETIPLQIPGGLHSAAYAQYGSRFLFITGRTNGLHGFNNDNNNFPPSQQNTNVIVVDIPNNKVYSRSLRDHASGLTPHEIDILSVTSAQSYQSGNRLYITGGYGVDSATGNFSTKDTLTAIDVPGLMSWAMYQTNEVASSFIRHISHPIFQVTGGAMYQYGQEPTLLIFGQNFQGFYNGSSNGIYTQQVRRFNIIDNGTYLGVNVLPSTPSDPDYRRRDLNVIPILQAHAGKLTPAFVALSGVFTLNTGIWTVPVEISANGTTTYMSDPSLAGTFKQAMNNYASAHAELITQDGTMYSILFGGLTFESYENGAFSPDPEIPFTNNVTAIKRTKYGHYTQHLLSATFPTIISTQSNPGNTLLFGTAAQFVIAANTPAFVNKVLNFAQIKKPTVIGYIIGGIMSTLPNTNLPSDAAASPYIFKVTLTPH